MTRVSSGTASSSKRFSAATSHAASSSPYPPDQCVRHRHCEKIALPNTAMSSTRESASLMFWSLPRLRPYASSYELPLSISKPSPQKSPAKSNHSSAAIPQRSSFFLNLRENAHTDRLFIIIPPLIYRSVFFLVGEEVHKSRFSNCDFALCRGWGLGDRNLVAIADERIRLMLFEDYSLVLHARAALPNKMTPLGAAHRSRERRAGDRRQIAHYADVTRQIDRSGFRCAMRQG